MIRILAALGVLLAGASAHAALETPSLAEAVASKLLPPVDERLPRQPVVVVMQTPGRHGGELRMLMAGAKDTRIMSVYGYARLVRYGPDLELVPDLLEAVEVENERVFTLRLRENHRWSDGHPFTAEDFRYWFEDVASNGKLAPTGLPVALLVDGERPRFAVIDERTVQYSWSKPNPLFLPQLAKPDPLYIFRPAHYLKRFHARYADAAALDEIVKKAGQRSWASLHNKLDNLYYNDNVDLPTLEPWVNTTKPPSERFIFTRNPFFHRVDPEGRQLPYIDRVALTIADAKIIPAKVGAGESDLQARYLRFDNYTFLKDAERRSNFDVRLWRTGPGAHLALYPNLNVADPVWRALFREARFRRALSLGVNRHEINQVIYYGLAIEGQNTVLPGSPLFRKGLREAWAQFDPATANRLLDELGLTRRDSEKTRLLPDGRPLQIVIETAGDSTEQTDVLELVRDSWRLIGVKLFSKPSQREVLRNRVFSGETMMTIDKGIENGLATVATPPTAFVPMQQMQMQWPKWGQFHETKGKSGEAPNLPAASRLMGLSDEWFAATDRDKRSQVWREILDISADEVFTIGLVAGVLQPVVVSRRLRGVPEDGIYNWDPGAHFGLYSPDSFWIAPPVTSVEAR